MSRLGICIVAVLRVGLMGVQRSAPSPHHPIRAAAGGVDCPYDSYDAGGICPLLRSEGPKAVLACGAKNAQGFYSEVIGQLP